MKKIIISFSVIILLAQGALCAETQDLNGFESLKQMAKHAASAEDAAMMNAFADVVKAKASENTISGIAADGTDVHFVLFDDGEAFIVLNIKKLRIGAEDKDSVDNGIDNFIKIITNKFGKTNIHSYSTGDNDLWVSIRIK